MFAEGRQKDKPNHTMMVRIWMLVVHTGVPSLVNDELRPAFPTEPEQTIIINEY